MKPTLIALLISLLVIPASLSAQVAFGPKAGVNLNTLKLDDPELSYESRSGYHAGLFFRGRFGNVAVQPELLLSTQRGEVEGTLLGTAQERFTYLNIPLIFKFYPVGGFNLQLGPQFGFLLDGEREYDSPLGSGTRDIKDYYKTSDVSVSFGSGFDFGFGLGLDVRYNLGIKDLNNAADGEEARSRVFLVALGWNFLK